jgi:hypothetical protein
MKGSVTFPAQPSDDAGLLRFLAIDYGWMVRDGILAETAENWQAFDHGYRVSDARLTSPVVCGVFCDEASTSHRGGTLRNRPENGARKILVTFVQI